VSFWRLFYHVVWATKDRAPLLNEVIATTVERSVRATSEELGARLIAIGAMPDHIHLVLSIPPRLAIADVIRRLKGSSSYAANGASHGPDSPFGWQSEYGVLSFGERALPDVVAYVRNQPARHAENRLCQPSNKPPTLPSPFSGLRRGSPGFGTPGGASEAVRVLPRPSAPATSEPTTPP
jgi:putative transposase